MVTLLLSLVLSFSLFVVDQVKDHHNDLSHRHVTIVKTNAEVPVDSVFRINDVSSEQRMEFIGLDNRYYVSVAYDARVEIENGAYVIYYGKSQEYYLSFRLNHQ